MTLIQGFRLEDIVLQIEMNTQLRERVNRNTVNLSIKSMLMCNIYNTDDEGLYLSLSLVSLLCLSLFPFLSSSIYVLASWRLMSTCFAYTETAVSTCEVKGYVKSHGTLLTHL